MLFFPHASQSWRHCRCSGYDTQTPYSDLGIKFFAIGFLLIIFGLYFSYLLVIFFHTGDSIVIQIL